MLVFVCDTLTHLPPHSELVFFNTFFCPYAQMAWIALNEKGAETKTEFVEGLTIQGGDYEVHPRLKALGHSGVPTLFHPSAGTVVGGSTDCIEYIDKTFGEPCQLLPKDPKLLDRALRCERTIHNLFTFQFYSMLLRQEQEEQEKAKRVMLTVIEKLLDDYTGPFYLGEQFSIADVSIAPYFDRMVVLDHYRNFRVPQEGSFSEWYEWSDNVLARPSVAATRQDRERIVEAYLRYAKCYVRNNWYHRVFHQGF
jgi:glutathione S-transferase